MFQKSEGSGVKTSQPTKLNNHNNLISKYIRDNQVRKKVLHDDKRETERRFLHQLSKQSGLLISRI